MSDRLTPTNIGRTIDVNVPSNRHIVIFAALTTLLMGGYRLLTGLALGDVVINALGAGVFTFIAWAIGRELDPDFNFTAFAAAGLMAIALFFLPLPHLLSAGILIAVLRIISRSTGVAPHQADVLMLMVGSGVVVALDQFWAIGVVVALAFALDTILPQPVDRRRLMIAGAIAVITVVIGILSGVPLGQFDTSVAWLFTVLFVSVVYAALLRGPQPPLESVGDLTGEPLQIQRVLAAQWLALGAGLLLFVTAGTVGIIAVLPLWAAIIGFIGRQLIQRRGG